MFTQIMSYLKEADIWEFRAAYIQIDPARRNQSFDAGWSVRDLWPPLAPQVRFRMGGMGKAYLKHDFCPAPVL